MTYDRQTLIETGGAYIAWASRVDIPTACQIVEKSLNKGIITEEDLIPLLENWLALKNLRNKLKINLKME